MDISKYFQKINFTDNPGSDLATLKKLHLHHMLNVPFENLDIHLKRKIILEPELLYKKIVENNRGGFCYEMNGLFYEVLNAIGFKAKMISARVYDEPEPGPEFDHMAIIVDLDGEGWLCDVGFGDSFLEPLKFEPELEQRQYGRIYKIEKLDGGNFKAVLSADGRKFGDMYRFSLIPRGLKEYQNMCNYHQSSPQSHFTQKRFCSLARTNGRITLSGMKLIETKGGVKKETELENDEEFDLKLKELFGIVI
jgi:N-hydroxyarylamine O-acetyltransferase